MFITHLSSIQYNMQDLFLIYLRSVCIFLYIEYIYWIGSYLANRIKSLLNWIRVVSLLICILHIWAYVCVRVCNITYINNMNGATKKRSNNVNQYMYQIYTIERKLYILYILYRHKWYIHIHSEFEKTYLASSECIQFIFLCFFLLNSIWFYAHD